MRIIGIVFLVILGVIALMVAGSVFGWFGGAVQVINEEFSPRMLFDRYVYLKDVAAQLDKKIADMKVYDQRFKALQDSYAGTPRAQWPRDDREQFNLWSSEAAGIRASYNSLAAEYNANMAKVNWRFAEVGNLPPGAIEPLPREFKPYVTQ